MSEIETGGPDQELNAFQQRCQENINLLRETYFASADDDNHAVWLAIEMAATMAREGSRPMSPAVLDTAVLGYAAEVLARYTGKPVVATRQPDGSVAFDADGEQVLEMPPPDKGN